MDTRPATSVVELYVDSGYFGGSPYFLDSRGTQSDFYRLTANDIVPFMKIMLVRFQKLRDGFTKDGYPVVSVDLTIEHLLTGEPQPRFVVTCGPNLKTHAMRTYQKDYQDILLGRGCEMEFLEKMYRRSPLEFAIGTHARVGRGSSIRRATLHVLFERQVFRLIFQFVAVRVTKQTVDGWLHLIDK